MERAEIISLLEETGALLSGHFQLTSGLHSDGYIQCARILQFPWIAEKLGRQLAKIVAEDTKVDLVVGPALGGIIVGYETARALRVPGIFTERVNKVMKLRRNFTISKNQQVLVVEDVVTTGGSVREVIELVNEQGGEVVTVASLIDRSQGKIDFGVPYKSLIKLDLNRYQPDKCPLCQQGITINSPGSKQK